MTIELDGDFSTDIDLDASGRGVIKLRIASATFVERFNDGELVRTTKAEDVAITGNVTHCSADFAS